MKKILSLLACVFILATAVAKKMPGKILFKNGTTADVTFNIPFKLLSSEPNFEALQYRVVYYVSQMKRPC